MAFGFKGISSWELQAAVCLSREENPKPLHHSKPHHSSLISTKDCPNFSLPDDGRPHVAVMFTIFSSPEIRFSENLLCGILTPANLVYTMELDMSLSHNFRFASFKFMCHKTSLCQLGSSQADAAFENLCLSTTGVACAVDERKPSSWL